MCKEIRAIEISRESLSVGSTFTESIALQSSLSAQFIHWSKSLTGFVLAAWAVVCQTPRGKDRGFWAPPDCRRNWSSLCLVSDVYWGFFPVQARKPLQHWLQECVVVWSSKVERCSWGCHSAATTFPTQHRKAPCPISQDFQKSDAMQSFCIWLCMVCYHIVGCCVKGKSGVKAKQQNQNLGLDQEFSHLKISQRHSLQIGV